MERDKRGGAGGGYIFVECGFVVGVRCAAHRSCIRGKNVKRRAFAVCTTSYQKSQTNFLTDIVTNESCEHDALEKSATTDKEAYCERSEWNDESIRPSAHKS